MSQLEKLRSGLTLVEVLVVIAIVGLLLAISLPAIQAARESARRSQCTNNLRQIGIALQHYEGAHRSLPSGYVSKVVPGQGDIGPGWGWAALILNYMEESSLRGHLRLNASIEDSTNAVHRTQPVSVFLCPSDTAESIWTTFSESGRYGVDAPSPESKICDVASANYIAMAGNGHLRNAGTGLFFRNSRVAFRQITDGTSKTIAIGERSSLEGNATWVGSTTGAILPLVQYENTGGLHGLSFHAAAMVLGQALDPDTFGDMIVGLGMFTSQHSGGVNFVFADGHIECLSNETDQRVFDALSTRAGRESTL